MQYKDCTTKLLGIQDVYIKLIAKTTFLLKCLQSKPIHSHLLLKYM